MRGLITRQPQSSALTAAEIPQSARHPFRDILPPADLAITITARADEARDVQLTAHTLRGRGLLEKFK